MTEICARLHAKRWVNLHSLRHTYATALVNAGMSIVALKEILGHKTIIMTLVYAKLAQVQLREDSRKPLERMTEAYVPHLLAEESAGRNEGVAVESIDLCFNRLGMFIRRQFDACADQGDPSATARRRAQLNSVSNRMAKLKGELLSLAKNT